MKHHTITLSTISFIMVIIVTLLIGMGGGYFIQKKTAQPTLETPEVIMPSLETSETE